MGKYGSAAIRATEIALQDVTADPKHAWSTATREIFPNSPSSQEKGCPKGAYLGLCSEGLVKGIAAGKYTNSIDNRRYAVEAVLALRENPSLASDPSLLWETIMDGTAKKQNSQTDVVISLWNNGLLEEG